MCYLQKNGRFALPSFRPYAIIETWSETAVLHLNNTPAAHLHILTGAAHKHPLLIVTPEIVDLSWLAYLARRMEKG